MKSIDQGLSGISTKVISQLGLIFGHGNRLDLIDHSLRKSE